jgi:DNA-binding transcriptional regulator YbjK
MTSFARTRMPQTTADRQPDAPRRKTRRSKGEQTRRKILDAVLTVIARDGTRGVTHRAVAAEAAVQLSLTTYYFRDIEDMIEEAFAHFSEDMRPDLESLWSGLFDFLDGFSAVALRKKSVREEICAQLANRATDHVMNQIASKPVGLAVEQVFFTQVRLSPKLRRLGAAHRRQLLEPLERVCRRFNPVDPALDAELLLNTVTALEYQALALSSEEVDEEWIRRLLRRHIGWVLGLKRA